ncbi:MAG: hypothetical protein BWX60_00406 [Candidatus Marinimicrobia bacterium ADurb.Bin030]|nr:MAG: hypothetical protein BWX60_00406 [Candidatus Marinimicrobia bacterium ADurb.Bin030]
MIELITPIHIIAKESVEEKIKISAIFVFFDANVRGLRPAIYTQFFFFAFLDAGDCGNINAAKFHQSFKAKQAIVFARKSYELSTGQGQSDITGFHFLNNFILFAGINNLHSIFKIKVALTILVNQYANSVANLTLNVQLLFLINDKTRRSSFRIATAHL